MITFEDAKKLKKGDVVYADGYRCYVVRVASDEDGQSAQIVYTDGGAGGDEFTAATGDPQLSLSRSP